MSDKKSWGHKVLGLFVEQDGEAARESGDQQGEPAESPSGEGLPAGAGAGSSAAAGAAPPLSLAGAVPRGGGGEVDFRAVFTAAGIGDVERDRVEKAEELLRSLPVETPTQVKRSIVEASLRAFGFPVESIIEAAVQEIQALQGCIGRGQTDTKRMLAEAQARIEQLTQEVIRVRQVMEQVTAEQADLERQCNQQRVLVQQVLEFFGQDAVTKVMRESAKLRGPEAPPEKP